MAESRRAVLKLLSVRGKAFVLTLENLCDWTGQELSGVQLAKL
jgi:hypothetical protein